MANYSPYGPAPGEKRRPLRAEGNMRYLQFIDAVTEMWGEGHPSIPVVPDQGKNFAQYPCIVYGLEMKKSLDQEPKPKLREELTDPDSGRLVHVYGQFFELLVKFTVVSKTDPRQAEEILDLFEDFMFEYTPVFICAGVADFVYARRIAASSEVRVGEDINKRSVMYYMREEKLTQISPDRVESVAIDIRKQVIDNPYLDSGDIDEAAATPTMRIVDLYQTATPNESATP